MPALSTGEIKDRLQSINEAEQHIQERSAQIHHLQSVWLDNEAFKNQDESAQLISEIEGLKLELEQDIKDYKKHYKQGIRIIDRLCVVQKGHENKELTRICRQILSKRYIEGLKWEKIACDLDYSVRQIYRLHGLAITSACRKTITKKQEKTTKNESTTA